MRWASHWLFSVTATLLMMLVHHGASTAADLPTATPEAMGFSGDRLKRLDALAQRMIDDKQYPGVVTLVARHGKVVYFNAVGQQDVVAATALRKDAIFRIFSMTKPVTAVAMMILYEEGRWNPQDPIAKFIPPFSMTKVYKSIDADGKMVVEDAVHPPTMRELMTMTAGFTYGVDATPVDKEYFDEQGRHALRSSSLQIMIDRLARAPLLYQPSSRWKYSLSADIEGYLIEKLSGMTLSEFMRRRIFEPLGMKDTGFYVPREKRDRLATLYKTGAHGELEDGSSDVEAFGYQFDREPSLPIGGGGLVSTAADYYRFAQMLLNGGELGGVRILGPRTVRLMISNHLAEGLMTQFRGGGGEFMEPRPGVGYGYGGAVITDPGLADVPVGRGTYLWNGWASTWFWVDPENDMLCIGLVQRLGATNQGLASESPPNLEELSRAVIYQSLIGPEHRNANQRVR